MNLYILRHASAGTRRTNPVVDSKRPLDKDGKQHCLLLGHVLTAMKVNFDVVLSSPLKRAVQTAALVGTETGYELPIVLSDALAPSGGYDAFEKLVAEHAHQENILVVGHNPNLPLFIGKLLTGGRSSARPATIRMRKGAIAKVNMSRSSGGPKGPNLQWLIEPRMVKSLYASSTRSSRRKTSRK
jgi:phosphohistidine phosphatase